MGILDALGLDRAHLVGRSMAGAIAIPAAQHHPRLVASLNIAGLMSQYSGRARRAPVS